MSRLLIALLTFSALGAMTLVWTVPKSSTGTINLNSAEVRTFGAPQLRDGWKRLSLREGVSLRVPQDMEAIEPFGDDVRYREAYRNSEFSITIAQGLLTPNLADETQQKLLFSCEAGHPAANNPQNEESTIEIDKRKAKLRIKRSSSSDSISADLCFPREDAGGPLRVAAICKDAEALNTAQQVFRSITFKN